MVTLRQAQDEREIEDEVKAKGPWSEGRNGYGTRPGTGTISGWSVVLSDALLMNSIDTAIKVKYAFYSDRCSA